MIRRGRPIGIVAAIVAPCLAAGCMGAAGRVTAPGAATPLPASVASPAPIDAVTRAAAALGRVEAAAARVRPLLPPRVAGRIDGALAVARAALDVAAATSGPARVAALGEMAGELARVALLIGSE